MALMDSEADFRKGYKKAGKKILIDAVNTMGIADDDDDLKSMSKPEIIDMIENYMGIDSKSKGGMPKKKKVPAIAISVGMVEIPKGKGKAKMMKGGMANKRQHMYVGGGSVTDKLKPMPKGAKGKGVRNLSDSVQMNMGFDPKS